MSLLNNLNNEVVNINNPEQLQEQLTRLRNLQTHINDTFYSLNEILINLNLA